MKFLASSSLGITLLGILFFYQNGCTQPNNSKQPGLGEHQSTVAASAEPTPTAPATVQNTETNGIPAREAKETFDLLERCKHAPVGKAKVTPLVGSAPLIVTFDGSLSSDPDGSTIVKWQWHFGNFESKEGMRVIYTYNSPGTYGIGLNVTDSQGQKTSDCSDLTTGVKVIVTDSSQN